MSSKETRVITPVGTLSYPHIAAPQPGMNGGPAKYSATIVFAEGTDLSQLQAAAIAAATDKWAGKAADMIKKGILRMPFRTDAEAKGYAPGSTFINARSGDQPTAVTRVKGPDGKPTAIPQEDLSKVLYAGAQVRASVTAFAYDTSGNKGVSFALNNVQKWDEGKRLDGRKAAEDEFTADLTEDPAELLFS